MKTDKEHFINFMLSNSDYDVELIVEFATEHLQNELHNIDNCNIFIDWENTL